MENQEQLFLPVPLTPPSFLPEAMHKMSFSKLIPWISSSNKKPREWTTEKQRVYLKI